MGRRLMLKCRSADTRSDKAPVRTSQAVVGRAACLAWLFVGAAAPTALCSAAQAQAQPLPDPTPAGTTAASRPTAASAMPAEISQRGASEPALARALLQLRDNLGRSCELHQLASSGALRFAACGAAGLWTFQMSNDAASLLDTQDLGGSVIGFFSANGRLWVEIRSLRAQELTAAASSADISPARGDAQATPTAKPPPPTAAAASVTGTAPSGADLGFEAEGKIIGREDETLVLTMQGQRPRQRTHIAFSGTDTTRARSEEDVVFAVGEVVASSASSVRVAIGTNEEVPSNARAHVTSAPVTRSSFAPPRAANIWELGFVARPFLVLEDLGAGAMLDASVGYRGKGPFHVQASLAPFAFATARAGALATVGAFLSGAYDSRLFEVGLGLGGQTVNDPDFGLDPGSGLLVSQLLRLGAHDGAHLAFRSYVTLFHSSFEFSSLRVDAQIPLGGRTWLRLAGGGGTIGLGYGEIGLRVLTSGNGGAGSIFLNSTIGWVGLYKSCNQATADSTLTGFCQTVNYDGPMLGAGLEFRL